MKVKTSCKKIFDIKKLPSILIVIICFGCSAIISILALKSQGATPFSMSIFGILAFGGEIVKFHFPSTAMTAKDLHWGIRLSFMLIGIVFIFYSVAFTFAFSKNETSSIKNDFIANSAEAKKAKKDTETHDSLISRLESELKTLKDDQIKEVDKWSPITHYSMRDKVHERFQKKIDKKSSELTTEQKTDTSAGPDKDTETQKKPVVTDKKITVGITNLFATVAQENIFLSIFAIFMEIAGIFALVDLKKRNRKVLKQYTTYEDYEIEEPTKVNYNPTPAISKTNEEPPTYIIDKPEKPVIYEKNKLPPAPKKKIQMSKDFNQDDVIKYLDCIYDKKNSPKLPISCGEKTIRDSIGFSDKIVRGIRYYLEQLDVLMIEEKNKYKRTKIIVPYSTALKRVSE